MSDLVPLATSSLLSACTLNERKYVLRMLSPVLSIVDKDVGEKISRRRWQVEDVPVELTMDKAGDLQELAYLTGWELE